MHAAWTDEASAPTGRRYFLDEFTVSYVPSALALIHARERAATTSPNQLLCVEEPFAVNASRLPNVHCEVMAIRPLFQKSMVLAGKKATRPAVLAGLPGAEVVHFSCHGSNDWEAPMDSGLRMADDLTGKNVLLKVRDLLELEHIGGRLATLSACETGVIGIELPEEVVALQSALLQAGYACVAASLWSVSDISTAMLMLYFYASWRGQAKELSPAQSLRVAQRWLRDTTNKEKAEYFNRIASKQAAGTRESDAVDFFPQLASRDSEQRDFAHPFWWAAFYTTGV